MMSYSRDEPKEQDELEKFGRNLNGMVNQSSETVKLLDLNISDSDSPPDLNLPSLSPPKRKVRFKRKFRSKKAGKLPPGEKATISCNCLSLTFVLSFLLFVIVTSTMIWFVMKLNSRVDELRQVCNNVEASSKGTPEAFHAFHSSLKQFEGNLTNFKAEQAKINNFLASVQSEVERLRQMTTEIKESIAAAPEIKTLPKDVSTLTKNVAALGSKINEVDGSLKTVKEQQQGLQSLTQEINHEFEGIKLTLEELKNETSSHKESNNNAVSKDIPAATPAPALYLDLQKDLKAINSSVELITQILKKNASNIENMNSSVMLAVNNLNQYHTLITELEDYVYKNLTDRIVAVELHSPALPNSFATSSDSNFTNLVNLTITAAVQHYFQSLPLPSSNNFKNVSIETLVHDFQNLLVTYLQLLKKLNNGTADINTVSNMTDVHIRALLKYAVINAIKEEGADLENLKATIKNLVDQHTSFRQEHVSLNDELKNINKTVQHVHEKLHSFQDLSGVNASHNSTPIPITQDFPPVENNTRRSKKDLLRKVLKKFR